MGFWTVAACNFSRCFLSQYLAVTLCMCFCARLCVFYYELPLFVGHGTGTETFLLFCPVRCSSTVSQTNLWHSNCSDMTKNSQKSALNRTRNAKREHNWRDQENAWTNEINIYWCTYRAKKLVLQKCSDCKCNIWDTFEPPFGVRILDELVMLNTPTLHSEY